MEILSDDFVKKIKRDPELCYYLAVLFALAEMNETSLDWLEQAVNKGLINYPLISEKDIILKRIRKEKRFKELMKRVKYEWEHFDD